MQSGVITKRDLFMAVFIIPALFLLVLFYPNNSNSNKLFSQTLPTSTISVKSPVKKGVPIHLSIPAIGIDTQIEKVGLTSNGAMDVPKGRINAGWFELGTRPGEMGSAVIAGHSGWKGNLSAVFDNLDKLHKGDKIFVKDDKGEVMTFVVREGRLYSPTADSVEIFNTKDGSHLNLITCAGIWSEVTKTSSKRLVVFADLLE